MSIGPLILDLDGIEISAEERELLMHPLVGGVIFFARNFQSADQISSLTAAISALRPELLTCVDQEGGRVQRFRDGFTRLPACRRLGELYDQDAAKALETAGLLGWLMAAELRAVAVDFSFAPVLDLDIGLSTVIGDRAFHRDAELVSILASAYIQGIQQAGMASVGKHFPGHGGVAADSHTHLPIDQRDPSEIEAKDLLPFRRLNQQGLLDAVMPAHVIYQQVDALPAGFSRYWIKDMLRQQIGFDGIVFSDDLNMAAAHVAGGIVERAEAAVEAGCDAILVCNNREGLIEVLDGFRPRLPSELSHRLLTLKARGPGADQRLDQQQRWREAKTAAIDLSGSHG